MKKLLNNKQALAIMGSLILLGVFFALGSGATIGFGMFRNQDSADKKYCIINDIGNEECFKPTQVTPVIKGCIQTESEACSSEDSKTNSPDQFRRICQVLQDKRGKGTDATFLTSSNSCLSCSDYYQTENLFNGNIIGVFAYHSKTNCEDNKFNPVPDAVKCENEEDCINNMGEIINILDVEKHVKSAKSPEERGQKTDDNPCPDLIIGGFLNIPQPICKEKLDKFFFPLKIMLSLVILISIWLLTLWVFNDVKLKPKKARMAISVTLGLIAGTLIWFYFYSGLIVLALIIIARIFIKKRAG